MESRLLNAQKQMRPAVIAQMDPTPENDATQPSIMTQDHLIHHSQPKDQKPASYMAIIFGEVWRRRPGILVIGESSTCSWIHRFFLSAGCYVRCVSDVLGAWEEFGWENIRFGDLAFVDIDVPQRAGVPMLPALRSLGSSNPTIAMASNISEDERNQYFGFGIVEVLHKSITEVSLVEMVKKHCHHLLINPE